MAPAAHPGTAAAGPGRRRGAGGVRLIEGQLWVAAYSRAVALRWLDDQRENGREIDGSPAPGWTAEEAAEGLTWPDKRKQPFSDLVRRDFTAPAPDVKWCGHITEVPTDEGKLYLATTLDLFSRRLLGYATCAHPDAELAGQAIKMAVAARGGTVTGVIFHSHRGSTYTAGSFTGLCARLGIRQSMGRVGSCFDNAAAESFFSTLE